MSGALSGHIFDTFSPTIPQGTSTPSEVQSPSISEETAKKIATLQAKLDKKLGPEYISQRPGPGGGPKLTYVEGWKVINLANEVFGFNGWSSNIVSLSIDFTDYLEETKRYCIGVTAIMRVTLRDGVYHEDIGYGMLENTKSKGAGLDKCKKEAVTDGLKRALRNFGNVLGNCLYDKSYAAEVVKIKVEPPKFNTDKLHRRPEFESVKPKVPAISPMNQIKPPQPLDAANNYTTPSRAPIQENRPQCSKPSNMRLEVGSTSSTSSTSAGTPQLPFKLPHPPAQLITPAGTPMCNPQRLPQQDKRVSFSNVTAPQPNRVASPSPDSSKTLKHEPDLNSDDSFGMNDEEFLALALTADMEGSGRNEIGRSAVLEETSLTAHDAEKIEINAQVSEQQCQGTMKPDNIAKKVTSISREEAIASALQAQRDNFAIGRANPETGPRTVVAYTTRQPSPQPQPAATSTTIPSSGSASSAVGGDIVQRQFQATAPSMAPRLYQNHLKQHHRNEGNHSTDQIQKYHINGSIPEAKNLPPPVMGGSFNFNSGMKAIPSSTPVIGFKRPAEAMSGGLGSAAQVRVPTSYKGGRPGMGLQHAAPAPRGPVDIGSREDAKRVKL